MSSMPKILIVDDNPLLCSSLKVFLSNRYSEITTANSGKEAIESLAADEFDLILLDVIMPEMSGYRVLDYINTHDLKTSVILITGYAPIELAKEAPPKGAYDCLMKPFDLDKLVATVENALSKNGFEKQPEVN